MDATAHLVSFSLESLKKREAKFLEFCDNASARVAFIARCVGCSMYNTFFERAPSPKSTKVSPPLGFPFKLTFSKNFIEPFLIHCCSLLETLPKVLMCSDFERSLTLVIFALY